MTVLVNAYTVRNRADPVLHASPHPPAAYSRTGSTYVAVCGTQVRNVTRVEWAPDGPGRRCHRCKKATT